MPVTNYPYKISVAICTYNRARFITKALDSLSNQNFDKNNFEVVVVDNNSTDNTQELLKTYQKDHPSLNFRFVTETNQGVAYTRTRGAMEAKGEIVAYLDDDCMAESNWLNEIAKFYDSHHEAMSTGGRIIPLYLTPIPKWVGKYFWGLVGNYDQGKNVFQMQGVRYPSGANMHFRKTAFEKYGYFDGDLGRSGKSLMAGEEKAMYLKLINANEKVYYLPHVIVHHHVEENKFDKEYVKRHSMGIGASERLMNKGSFVKLSIKFFEYLAKLGFAIAYGFLYLLQGQLSKMSMLTKFRWWVIEGFINPEKTKG